MKAEAQEAPEKACFYYGVAVGQFVAFLGSFAGFMTEMLGSNSCPMFMAACNAALLTIVYFPWTLRKKGFHLSVAWWKYALLSVIDIGAAYCSLLALRYTSITSWSLLQPFSFLAVVPVSILLLHASYNWKHLVSGIFAFVGLVILLYSDLEGGQTNEQHSAQMILFGEICAIVATLLYGTSSVLLEAVLKGKVPEYEVLGVIGFFSAIYGFVIAFFLGEISADMFPKSTVPLYMTAAVTSNFGVYSLGMSVLKHAGAAVLEISFLATNLWSVLWKLTVVHSFHTNLIGFIIAFVMIISGVTSFTLSGNPNKQTSETEQLELRKQMKYNPVKNHVVEVVSCLPNYGGNHRVLDQTSSRLDQP